MTDLILPFVLGAVLPDLGIAGFAFGEYRPYNLLHTYWTPAAIAVTAPLLGPPVLALAAAWAIHIAIDRAVGYGLRTRDGRQRADVTAA